MSTPLTVLIVDDDADDTSFLGEALDLCGTPVKATAGKMQMAHCII